MGVCVRSLRICMNFFESGCFKFLFATYKQKARLSVVRASGCELVCLQVAFGRFLGRGPHAQGAAELRC